MSVRFSGAGQNYTATNGLPGSTYTIIAWVYLVSDRNTTSTMWVYDASGADGHNVRTQADGVTLEINSSGDAITPGALTVATWHRVAFAANGTSGTLYLGGASGALAKASGAIPSLTISSVSIGSFSTGSASWLDGRLANLKVYGAVLTQAEIELELGSWDAVRTANLLRHHKFQTAETTDYSGNGNTLSGGTGATTEADPPITWLPVQPTPVADRGSTANATAGTTSSVTLTSPTTIAVKNYLIARVAVDNSGSAGAAPGCTITDPRSNTWTVLGPALADPGAASAGATAYLCYVKVTTAYQAADALTFNWGGTSTTAKAIVVEEWTNIDQFAPTAVSAVTNDSGAASSTTAVSVAITPTAAYQVVYTCLATEGIAGDSITYDTDTTNGNWSGGLTRVASANATATNNQCVAGQYKIATSAGAQTWNATITSRDWAAVAVVLSPTQIQPRPVVVNQAALVRAASW